MAREANLFSLRYALLGIALIGIASLLGSTLAQQAPSQQPPTRQVAPPPNAITPAARQEIEPPIANAGEGVDLQVRAIDAATGKGLGGVQITLSRLTPTPPRGGGGVVDNRSWNYSKLTDASGIANFSNMMPDRYKMADPILADYGVANGPNDNAIAPPGQGATYSFSPRAKPAPVTFRMWKAASVDGIVEDHDGNPLTGVMVQIVEEGWVGGLRTLSLAQAAPTDKAGKFVMPAVLPGTYYLRAVPPAGLVQEQLKASDKTADKHVAFVDTIYPNAMYFEQAAPLVIVPGVNVFGLHIEMQKSKYFSLTGRVFGIPQERQQVSGLVLMRRVSFDSPFPFIWANPYAGAINVRLAPDGSFTAPDIPPGPYWAGYTPAGDIRGGTQFLIEDHNVDDFKFDVTRGATFSGKIEFEDGAPVAAFPPSQLNVFASNMGVYQRSLFPSGPNGEFNTSGLPVGTWRLEFSGPVVIRKIVMGGKTYEGGKFDLDADTGPALITLGRGGAAIQGSVELHEQARAYVRGMVTISPLPLHPIDTAKRKLLDNRGNFMVEHLEAGRYRVCAWLEEGAEVGALLGNPRYEEKFNAACETVVLAANERKEVRLKQISAPEFK